MKQNKFSTVLTYFENYDEFVFNFVPNDREKIKTCKILTIGECLVKNEKNNDKTLFGFFNENT